MTAVKNDDNYQKHQLTKEWYHTCYFEISAKQTPLLDLGSALKKIEKD